MLISSDDAVYHGEYTMAGVVTELWGYAYDDNVTVRLTVAKATCMPVTEEIRTNSLGNLIHLSFTCINAHVHVNSCSELKYNYIIRLQLICE